MRCTLARSEKYHPPKIQFAPKWNKQCSLTLSPNCFIQPTYQAFPFGFGVKNEKVALKIARNMARVKEQGGWLWLHSSRGQNRKSSSLDFFAPKPNANGCYQRRLCFTPRHELDGLLSTTDAETIFIKTCLRGRALPQVGPLEVVCHQSCVSLETDLQTIQNSKKERFDRVLPPPPLLFELRSRQSERRLGCLCWRLPGTSGATWLHGIGFIFKMAAIRCKVLTLYK